MFEIRELAPEDATAFAGHTFPAYRHLLNLEEAADAILDPALADGSGPILPFALGSFSGGRPAGLVLGAIPAAASGTGSASILSLFVDGAHRRQGIGAALIARAEEYLEARGQRSVRGTYMSGKPSIVALEKILTRRGWTAPRFRFASVRFSHARISQAEWIRRIPSIDGYEILPWSRIGKEERLAARERHRASPWISEALRFWKFHPDLAEPYTSLGMRYRGELVGWVLNHAVQAEGMLRFSTAFVRWDLARLGLALPAVARSISLMPEAGFTHGTFCTPELFESMRATIDKYVAPWSEFAGETRGVSKQLEVDVVESSIGLAGRATAAPDIETVVRTLATSDGREAGSDGHAAARRYLLDELESRGLEPYSEGRYELAYEHGGVRLANLVGVLPGTRPELAPALVGAHYDTCGPYPGADDNAAAVAIVLSAVEPLRALRLERSILFALFDAEEPPYHLSPAMGSTQFYENQRSGEIHCALVLDLVGHDLPVAGWEDVLFVTGVESDPALGPVFRQAAPTAQGIRLLPTLTRYIGDMSDYHAFRLDRRPYLFFSCGRWEHYHQPTDTPDRLNYGKISAIAGYFNEVARRVAEASLEGPFEGHDTTELELEHFRAVTGPLAKELGVELGNRADLDRMIDRMVESFGL